jgi:hypothetical protein
VNQDVGSYLAGKPPAAVYTHRFKITSAEELDGRIRDWLVEAHDTVGPGTR